MKQRLEIAWAFLVVSSDAQSETLAHQRQWAERAAKERNWQLGRVIDGVASGRRGPRSLMTLLLRDLRLAEPRPAFIMMTRLDRVGRGSIVDSQIVLRDLKELGVQVYTRDQGIVEIDSATDELIAAVKFAVARQENDVRRDKLLNVYERKRRAGLRIGNRRPYGLRLSKNARDEPIPSHAKAIRRAFQLRAEGLSYDAIGAKLARMAPAQTNAKGDERKILWTASRVQRLLDNEAYRGVVVDEAMFASAQRVRQAISSKFTDRKLRFDWPLSGVLRCTCGRIMTGQATGRSKSRVRYYACRQPLNHDGVRRYVRADRLEADFVELLKRLRVERDRVVERKLEENDAEDVFKSLSSARRELADLGRRREAAWDAHANAQIRSEDLSERLERLNGEQRVLERTIAELSSQHENAKQVAGEAPKASELLKRAPALYRSASVAEQRQIAHAVAEIVGGFLVDDDQHIQIGAPPNVVPAGARRNPPP